VVESVVLLTASRGNASHALRDAATAYKVDTDAIATKVKGEFAGKEKNATTKRSVKPGKPIKKEAA
jgi:ParB family chromosome partitioning protein